MMEKRYDERISIAKAICIILMVIGHAGVPEIVGTWIYQFHMPCFFFISGFLFKDKYLNDMSVFVKRRFKGLWWPFVKWSLIFLLFHNVFARIHFYDTVYGWRDFIDKIFHIVTMTGSEQLLGGFWFLKELLWASIISLFSLKLYSLISQNLKQGGAVLTLLFLVIAFALSIVHFKIPTISSKTMLASAFYMAGYTYNKLAVSKKNFFTVGIIGLVSVFVVSFFFHGGMECKSWSILISFIVALIGTIAIVNLSGLISGQASKVLNYIGSKTLYILTFHFISFKLVSLIKIWQYGLPISKLSSFPVISEHNSVYWIVYSIIGVLLPLLIWRVKTKIERIVLNKDN